MNKRGTSDIPLVMGIIGTVLNVPATTCAATCGGIISGCSKIVGSDTGEDLGNLMVFVGLISGLSGLVGGIYAKKNPNAGGTLLIIATLFAGIEAITTFNLFSLIVFVIFLIGAIYSFIKTEYDTDLIPKNLQSASQNVNIINIDKGILSESPKNKIGKQVNIKNNYPDNGELKNPYK